MNCPYCGKEGLKKLKGYCCRSHRRLHLKPPPKVIPCAGCGYPQRRNKSAISASGIVYCGRCKRPKGEQHYKYKEGQYIDRAGYRMILINSEYRREHRIVWEEANLASLLPTGTIHHIRVDLPNNKIYNHADNLLLLSDTEHGTFHRLFEAKRYEEAFTILKVAANRQFHYPSELDKLEESIVSI